MQFFVAPSWVITIFAVAEPSYVTTSRRLDTVGAWPSRVSVTCIDRVMVPAVGNGCSVVDVALGITTFVVVSPASRTAVK